MPERNFTEDLKILVTAYLPTIANLRPVEQLVVAQCALYLEMNEAYVDKKEEGHDLG